MKINDLNIIAQRLGAFGKEHLGIDHRGHTVPTTSSLGGRIASWIRSRHSDTAAQANRDVMTGIINTIRAIERQLVGIAFRQAAYPAVQVQGAVVFGAFQGDRHVIETERANAVLGLKAVHADSGTKFCNDMGNGMHMLSFLLLV